MKTDNEKIEAFYVSLGGKPSLKEDLWFYESDWNMLMPVVEKIYDVADTDVREINNEGLAIFELSLMTPLEEVYKAVVQFIDWYTSQTLKK